MVVIRNACCDPSEICPVKVLTLIFQKIFHLWMINASNMFPVLSKRGLCEAMVEFYFAVY